MIGLHLLIDAVTELPIGQWQVEKILRELPGQIDMHILNGPHIVRGHPANPGWTGFVIIDKSHIAIHTFDEGNLISIDVFSCKPFKADAVDAYLRSVIPMKRINLRVVERQQAS